MTGVREHICIVCNKYYTSRQSLWNHNKKYHNTIISNIVSKVVFMVGLGVGSDIVHNVISTNILSTMNILEN